MIYEVHPYMKAVPVEQIIGSLGTSLEKFKGEDPTTKEEGAYKAYDAGFHSYLRDRWVTDVYPMVLPHKVKRYLEELYVLYPIS